MRHKIIVVHTSTHVPAECKNGFAADKNLRISRKLFLTCIKENVVQVLHLTKCRKSWGCESAAFSKSWLTQSTKVINPGALSCLFPETRAHS